LEVEFKIRPMRTDDEGFVFNSWLRSFRKSVDMESKAYYLFKHSVIERLLRDSRTLMAVACDDPDQIFGWVCFAPFEDEYVVHYLYVKATFRKLGIGRRLIESLPPIGWYTHKTYGSAFFDVDYNPYLAGGGL
jgi:predicted N-acetyltransferase YhbS